MSEGGREAAAAPSLFMLQWAKEGRREQCSGNYTARPWLTASLPRPITNTPFLPSFFPYFLPTDSVLSHFGGSGALELSNAFMPLISRAVAAPLGAHVHAPYAAVRAQRSGHWPTAGRGGEREGEGERGRERGGERCRCRLTAFPTDRMLIGETLFRFHLPPSLLPSFLPFAFMMNREERAQAGRKSGQK